MNIYRSAYAHYEDDEADYAEHAVDDHIHDCLLPWVLGLNIGLLIKPD